MFVQTAPLVGDNGAMISADGRPVATAPVKFETDSDEFGGLQALFDMDSETRNAIETITFNDGEESELEIALQVCRQCRLGSLLTIFAWDAQSADAARAALLFSVQRKAGRSGQDGPLNAQTTNVRTRGLSGWYHNCGAFGWRVT